MRNRLSLQVASKRLGLAETGGNWRLRWPIAVLTCRVWMGRNFCVPGVSSWNPCTAQNHTSRSRYPNNLERCRIFRELIRAFIGGDTTIEQAGGRSAGHRLGVLSCNERLLWKRLNSVRVARSTSVSGRLLRGFPFRVARLSDWWLLVESRSQSLLDPPGFRLPNSGALRSPAR